jgi:DNA replication licensing factor MCM4
LAYHETRLLYRQLLNFPQEIIPLMDMVISEYFCELFPSVDISSDPIQVRPFNIGKSVNMRLLNPEDIDKLIYIKGLIIRVSNIIPDMRVAYFSCCKCGAVVTSENIKGRINEPAVCPNQECTAHHTMNIIHNRCLFSDKQIIKIQETPDSIPDGQTPHSVTLCFYDTLVDSVRPGDRVEVTGIYRSSPVRVNPKQRKIKSIFRTYIDVVHVKRTDTDTFNAEYMLVSGEIYGEKAPENTTDISDIIALSQSPDLYEKLSDSVGTLHDFSFNF